MSTDTLAGLLAGAPADGPCASGLMGWRLPDGVVLCSCCAGRLMGRGLDWVFIGAVALWDDPVACHMAARCSGGAR